VKLRKGIISTNDVSDLLKSLTATRPTSHN